VKLYWTKIDKDKPGRIHPPQIEGDVGWDLEASEDTDILPGKAIDVPTNVAVALPTGYWCEIRARSSIARRGLQVDAGTIDNGYRGPLYALVRNMTDEVVTVCQGERVAQLVLHQIFDAKGVYTSEFSTDTARGVDGFGSTGR
jgi:deoxyuridine 5'-triphosphate nucleotidohydrolase